MRGALVGGALAAALLVCAAGPAMAASDPGWFDGHSTTERQAIVNYLYKRTGHATAPHSGDAETMGHAIAQSVIDAGEDDAPLAPEAGALELLVAPRVGLLPRLGLLAPSLNPVGGAFVLAIAVGIGGDKLFAMLAGPDDSATGGSPNWSWNYVTWRPYGYEIYYGATVQQRPGAYLYRSGGVTIMWDEPPCPFSGFTPAPGARMQYAVPSAGDCRVWDRDRGYVYYQSLIDYPYLLDSDIRPMAPLRPFDPLTDDPDVTVDTPPDPGPTAVADGLDLLDEAEYELLRGQIDWALTPGAQREEEPIRAGVDLTENDRACKAYFGETRQGDPGRRSPDADPLAPDWDYDVDSFSDVYNPLTRTTQAVKLRWGNGVHGWGYRHVKFWHGWDAAARLRTALALADPAPTADGFPTSFRYVVTLPTGPAGVTCQQRVVVSYREDSFVPPARHIITSFVDGVG